MTNEPAPSTDMPPESPSRLKRFASSVRLAVRTLQVRLRFIVILAGAFVVAGQWDTLRNYWDHWTRELVKGEASSRAVPPNIEYFCPMDPVVISMSPRKCDICNMALVRRKVGDTAPLPSGVLARMQLSPYRMQPAGIQTAPVDYRPTAREVTLIGIVRDDGLAPGEKELAGQRIRIAIDRKPPPANIQVIRSTGRSSAWLERTVRDREVGGSNPLAPTGSKVCRILDLGYLPAAGSAASEVVVRRYR